MSFAIFNHSIEQSRKLDKYEIFLLAFLNLFYNIEPVQCSVNLMNIDIDGDKIYLIVRVPPYLLVDERGLKI